MSNNRIINGNLLTFQSNIRREQKKRERNRSQEMPLRDTVLFAIGAVTLSLLFCAHTGIIQVVSVEKPARKKSIKET